MLKKAGRTAPSRSLCTAWKHGVTFLSRAREQAFGGLTVKPHL